MRYLLSIVLISSTTILFSQNQQNIEVSLLIPELVSGKINFGLEYIPTKYFGTLINTGVQVGSNRNVATGSLSDTDFYALIQGRFYPFPKFGGDRFYFAPYGLYEYDQYDDDFGIRTKDNRAIVGGILGYKYVFKDKVFIDLNLGAGKVFGGRRMVEDVPVEYDIDELDYHLPIMLSLGLRF